MMSQALVEAIEALRPPSGDKAEARERLEVIRLHQKALQTVIDLEVGIEKRGRQDAAPAGEELDLAAAREEIERRISGIRASLGD